MPVFFKKIRGSGRGNSARCAATAQIRRWRPASPSAYLFEPPAPVVLRPWYHNYQKLNPDINRG